nr:phage tail protein [uncultured Mucilaginibacter sp.]
METIVDAITALASSPVNIWPIGMITPFTGDVEKITGLNAQGWFFCNGAELNENEYPRLFQILGNTCGGTRPKFCLPDLRGVFLRGVDGEGAISRDPDAATRKSHISADIVGNQVLSREDSELKEHTHITPDTTKFVSVEKACGIQYGLTTVSFERFERPGARISTTETGGNETRAVNVSVNYIIFAGPAAKVASNRLLNDLIV